jgi:hypothetical protein
MASLLLFGGIEFAWSHEKIGGAEKGLCGCEELLVPNQQATVSQSEIAVTEASVVAISDPIIAEGFAGGLSWHHGSERSLFVGGVSAAAAIGGATTGDGGGPTSTPVSPSSSKEQTRARRRLRFFIRRTTRPRTIAV